MSVCLCVCLVYLCVLFMYWPILLHALNNYRHHVLYYFNTEASMMDGAMLCCLSFRILAEEHDRLEGIRWDCRPGGQFYGESHFQGLGNVLYFVQTENNSNIYIRILKEINALFDYC